MKKVLISLAVFALFIPALAAETGAGARLDQALRSAAAQNAAAQPLLSLYFNDASQKTFFSQVTALVGQLPPAGQKSFLQLTAADYPAAHVNLVFDTAAHINAQLRMNRMPPLGMTEDGRTVEDSARKDGRRIFTVFIVTDHANPAQLGTEEAAARAVTTLAHEIYGHVYYGLRHKDSASHTTAAKERDAYAQSAAFLKRLLAHENIQRSPAKARQALQSALEREERSLKNWNAMR